MPDEDLSKLTVAVLKERLREAGLPQNGLKKDLVERLSSHLQGDVSGTDPKPDETSAPDASEAAADSQPQESAADSDREPPVSTQDAASASSADSASAPVETSPAATSVTPSASGPLVAPVPSITPVPSATPVPSMPASEPVLATPITPSTLTATATSTDAMDVSTASDDKKRRASTESDESDAPKRARVEPQPSIHSRLTAAAGAPAAAPPTESSVLVQNLVRPFPLSSLKELLGKTGTVKSFWIDNLRSYSYVTFASPSEAAATRDALHGAQFPAVTGKLLAVSYVPDAHVDAALNGSAPVPAAAPVLPVATSAPTHAAHPLAGRLAMTPAASAAMQAAARMMPEALPRGGGGKSLDELFKKTNAKPQLYYLPRTPAQVDQPPSQV